MKLTVIIPTFNEEHNIQRALDSACFADEIIVIDSFSTDQTLDIVQKSKAKIYKRKFDNFSNQKNFAIAKASNSWVFLLDADEQIKVNLQKEILSSINNSNIDAYYVYRYFFMKNKRVKFAGMQRDKAIRLFKKDICKYTGLVHEKIKTEGNVGYLKNRLYHYSYTSYNQYKSKLRQYAKLQAQEMFSKNSKPTILHLIFKPVIRFLIHYLLRLGFLDGIEGFKISFLQSLGVRYRYVEFFKLSKNKEYK